MKHFVDWEYKEKRPKSVKALRVKSKSMFSMGALPNFHMKIIGPVVYIVISDHIDTLTVYFFNKFGDKLGSEKYELFTQRIGPRYGLMIFVVGKSSFGIIHDTH